MPLTLTVPSAPMSLNPALTALARITEETELDDGVRVAGELVEARRRARSAAHDRARRRPARPLLPAELSAPTVQAGRRGDDFCRRLAAALHPDFFRGDDWRFSYRTSDDGPAFVVASGSPAPDPASCFLHLQPGTARGGLRPAAHRPRRLRPGLPRRAGRRSGRLPPHRHRRRHGPAQRRRDTRPGRPAPAAAVPVRPRRVGPGVHPAARARGRPRRRAGAGHVVRPAPLPAGRRRHRRGRARRRPRGSTGGGPPDAHRTPASTRPRST